MSQGQGAQPAGCLGTIPHAKSQQDALVVSFVSVTLWKLPVLIMLLLLLLLLLNIENTSVAAAKVTR